MRRLMLVWYRFRYECKLEAIAWRRERGLLVGVNLQLDALELLQKINRLNARTI